ncbi:MAG: fasciclin domain-containing protein [Gemmatimonas sp.]
MKYVRTFLHLMAAASLSIAGTAHAQAAAHTNKTIVDVAVENGSFKTLVAALKAADLVEALQAKGPYTVFAPSDAAFAKLPAGTVDALLKDKAKLAAILKYHVISGNVSAADVMKAKEVKPATLNGAALDVKVMGTKVHVNNATVVTPDVHASNGTIHVIDTVLMPPSK